MSDYDVVNAIMDYECGTMETTDQILELFSNLIKTGKINHLQGTYGRTAKNLIESGYLDHDGNILENG